MPFSALPGKAYCFFFLNPHPASSIQYLFTSRTQQDSTSMVGWKGGFA